jgi:glycosyltransferase involved in cell wall biosynthesis
VSAEPSWSVVVPSYRSLSTIDACLRSILDQDVAVRPQIIVVDSSRDGTAARVEERFPEVDLVRMAERTEPAAARNIGAGRASGELLAFLDSDCVAPRDWLRRLEGALLQGYEGAGGAIANGNGESLVSWAGYLCEFREFLPGGPARDSSNLTLGNVAYRRDVFLAAGGFPTGCFPQEDQVFHQRLRAKRARLRLDPSIVVAHTHRTERDAFLDHQRHIGQANARVLDLTGRSGAALARHRALAFLTLPALVPFRFARTLLACRRVEHGLIVRRPRLLWLCWLGMCSWGRGFLEAAEGRP